MKTVVFLANGFEECEALIVVDILRRAGIETITASIMNRLEICSSRNITIKADVFAEDIDYRDVNLIYLPGGRIGIENLGKSKIVLDKCQEFAKDKMLAAICAAPSILANLGLLEGKRATCHPDFEEYMHGTSLTYESVTLDGNIITGQGLGATFEFAFELVNMVAGQDKVFQLKKAICYKK